MLPPPPRSTLFPYTTLFRSEEREARGLPPINSIWLHGQGALRPVTSPFTRVMSEAAATRGLALAAGLDRKSTRLNSSHLGISYAVFCLKKKKKTYNKDLQSK